MSLRDTREIDVTPISEEHIPGFHSCLDSVAHERKYLGMVQAPAIESTRGFVESNIKNNYPQFVAVDDNRVVGWCDILPQKNEGYTHCGILGIGVLNGYRGQGLGNRLMEATMNAAKDFGIERVELEVHASNISAVKWYERLGFVHEGIKRKARKIDGKYDDDLVMALFL